MRANECQQRQGNDQGDDARKNEHIDRIEAHGAQGVDLLSHLHGAQFGGVGAAGAAGDHDGDDQHADFAQHEDADHVDHVFVGAELAEMKEALLGDDAADQEGNEQDDRHGLPADAVQVMDRGGGTEGCWALGGRQHGKAKRANHGNKGNEVSSQLEQKRPTASTPSRADHLRAAAAGAVTVAWSTSWSRPW